MWQETGIIALALFCAWAVYVFGLGGALTLLSLAQILAGVSGVLLAMSFSLSSFSYYFDFLDTKLIYRKYLGLAGYFVALGYTLIMMVQKPDFYIFGFTKNFCGADILLGSIAMAIFTLMALISNKWALHILGPVRWKFILGLGYIAYALLVMRGIILDQELWRAWFADDISFLSVRMILTVLGMVVLCFRASVPFHKICYNRGK
jgi:DMSO/TMAO reductase YedYZ heme-binding membrane subunit